MCDVIKLPGAAEAPVLQAPRRGRLPKAIGSLYGARARRHAREHEQQEDQRQRDSDVGRSDEAMIELLYSALAEVRAGHASGLLVAMRDRAHQRHYFLCEGVYKTAPDVAADFAEVVAETLREGDWAGDWAGE